MLFTITRENFIKVLQKAERFTGKNTTLPILSAVLLKAESNTLKVHATDLEIGSIFETSAKIEEEGSAVVLARTLIQFIQNINSTAITVQVKKNKLFIEGDNYKTNFHCFSVDDFPIIPENIKEKIITIESDILNEGLTRAVSVTSLNANRPEISGVFFSIQKNILKFVGTDSFRLSEITIPIKQKSSSDTSLILPLKLGQELIKLFQEEKTEVSIFSNAHQIAIYGEKYIIVSRLIEGSYPPYEQIIPQSSKTKIHLEKSLLKKGIEMSGVFSSKLNDIKLSFDFNKNILLISSQNSEIGEYNYKIEYEGEGENQDIILNWRFFLDGIEQIEENEILLEINSASSPILVKGIKNQNIMYLLMPIRPV